MEKFKKLLINTSEGQFVNPESNQRLPSGRADQDETHGTQVEAIAKTELFPEEQAQIHKVFVNDNKSDNLKLENDAKLSPTRAERVDEKRMASANIEHIAPSVNKAEMHELATGRSPPNEMKSKNAGSTRAGKLEAAHTNANLEGTASIALFKEGQRVCVWWARKQIYSGYVQRSNKQEVVIAYDDGDVKAYIPAILQTRLEQAARELGVTVEEVGGKLRTSIESAAKSATDGEAQTGLRRCSRLSSSHVQWQIASINYSPRRRIPLHDGKSSPPTKPVTAQVALRQPLDTVLLQNDETPPVVGIENGSSSREEHENDQLPHKDVKLSVSCVQPDPPKKNTEESILQNDVEKGSSNIPATKQVAPSQPPDALPLPDNETTSAIANKSEPTSLSHVPDSLEILPTQDTIKKAEANVGGPEELSEDNTATLSVDAVQNEDDNQGNGINLDGSHMDTIVTTHQARRRRMSYVRPTSAVEEDESSSSPSSPEAQSFSEESASWSPRRPSPKHHRDSIPLHDIATSPERPVSRKTVKVTPFIDNDSGAPSGIISPLNINEADSDGSAIAASEDTTTFSSLHNDLDNNDHGVATGAQNACSIVEAAPESKPTEIILGKSNFGDVNESCSDEASLIKKDFADFLKKYNPGDAETNARDQSAPKLCSPRFEDLLQKYDSLKLDEGSPLHGSTPSPGHSKRPSIKLEFEDFLRKVTVDMIPPEKSLKEPAPNNALSAQTLQSSKQLQTVEISREAVSETVEASTTERSNSESALQESKPDQAYVEYNFKDFLAKQALSSHSSSLPQSSISPHSPKMSEFQKLTIDTTPPNSPETMSQRVSSKEIFEDRVHKNSPRTCDKNTEQINLQSVEIHCESIDVADIKPETPEAAARSKTTPLSVKQKLENLLCQRAPDKLQNIPSLLDKFAGREAELLAKVEAKYNQDLGKKEGTAKDQQDFKIEVLTSPNSESQPKTPVAKFDEKRNSKKTNAEQNLSNETSISPSSKSQPKTPVAKLAEKSSDRKKKPQPNFSTEKLVSSKGKKKTKASVAKLAQKSNSKKKNSQQNLSTEKLVFAKGKKKPKTHVTKLAEKNNSKKKSAHRNAKNKKAQRNLIIDRIPRRKTGKSHSEQSKKENTQRLQLTISLSENLREKIRAIFHEHAPDKLQTLPPLLQKFQGKETVLLSKMKEMYEPVKAPESTGESCASKPRTRSRMRTRKDLEIRAASELCDKEAALLAKLTTKSSRRTSSRIKSRDGSTLNLSYPRSKSLPPRMSPKAKEDNVSPGDEVAVIEQSTASTCSTTTRRQRERHCGRQKRKHPSKHKQSRQKGTMPQHKHASRDKKHQSENKRLMQQSKQKQRALHAKPNGNTLSLSQAEQEIRTIFKAHAPDKLSNISKLMIRFRGKEQVLLTKIKKKYGLLST